MRHAETERHWPGRRERGAWLALLWLALALSGGDSTAEEPSLAVSGELVHFWDLRCLGDDAVAAGATIGTDGALLHSADGGLGWSVVARGGDLADVTPSFFDEPGDSGKKERPLRVTGYRSTGLLQFNHPLGPSLASSDGGRRWSAAPTRLPSVLHSRDPVARVPSPIVVDAAGRWATIRRAPEPAVLLSDDQGATWTLARVPRIEEELYHLIGDGRARLVAVGSLKPTFGSARLVVAQSDDGGRTWSVAMDEPADHLACSPRLVGRIDGALMIHNPCRDYGQRFYRSSDGGRTWSAHVFERHFRGAFEKVEAIDDRRWIALSQEGPNRSLVAWVSDNGGVDWRGQRTGFAAQSGDLWLHMQATLSMPGGIVLAYVGDGQLLRSDDRGESWKLIDTGLPRKTTLFMSSSCTDGQRLVVLAGNKGMQVRSADAGLTWQRGRLATAPP